MRVMYYECERATRLAVFDALWVSEVGITGCNFFGEE